METIINKVAESGIVTLDLSIYLPEKEDIVFFDLRPFLFREMILREKDYRAALQTHEWKQYEDKHIVLGCSVDAIIPVWAYMLATTYMAPFAKSIYFGTVAERYNVLAAENIFAIDKNEFADKRVVLKGCGDVVVPEAAYIAATAHLQPVVKSIMYGEPCSTVPVYKKPKV